MQLSGGEQQMLSMARTLLGKPSILLLDEPLEGLAPVICDELMATISHLAASGEMTVILVEQQIERALDFAGRVLILERGREAWRGSSSELRSNRTLVEPYSRRSPTGSWYSLSGSRLLLSCHRWSVTTVMSDVGEVIRKC